MVFTVQNYHDLVQLLIDHPEWKAELRGLIFSEEMMRVEHWDEALAAPSGSEAPSNDVQRLP